MNEKSLTEKQRTSTIELHPNQTYLIERIRTVYAGKSSDDNKVLIFALPLNNQPHAINIPWDDIVSMRGRKLTLSSKLGDYTPYPLVVNQDPFPSSRLIKTLQQVRK